MRTIFSLICFAYMLVTANAFPGAGAGPSTAELCCVPAPHDVCTAADKAACPTGTCIQKTDGSSGGAVTDGECGDDFFATADSTTACAAAPCNMATAADKAACCTAVATTTDAPTTAAPTANALPITKKQVNDCEKDFKKARNTHKDLRKAILTALKHKN